MADLAYCGNLCNRSFAETARRYGTPLHMVCRFVWQNHGAVFSYDMSHKSLPVVKAAMAYEEQ